MTTFKTKWRLTAFWVALTLALDFGTKVLAQKHLTSWEPLTIIPDFFNLILVYNTGAAFSLFSGDAESNQGLKMAALALVSMIPFIYFYVKAKPTDRQLLISLGLIWGGALGNIYDRFRWGAVIDFFDLYWGNMHWPVFNVADIAICLGAGLFALSILREKPQKTAKDTDNNSAKNN